jgi:glycosyltransferase involved in cell wall biosynthesis
MGEIKPDLVHIDEEPYNLATFLAIRQAGRVGARSLFFTWQNIGKRYPPPFGWFESYAYRHSSGAIAGMDSASIILKSKGYSKPVWVIPQFGVDPAVFYPRQAARPKRRTVPRPALIGYVGRMVEEKGLVQLLDAVSGMQGDWRLLMIGTGPLTDRLKDQVRRLRLDSLVSFIEWLPSSAMPGKLRELDILVLPSLTRPNWKEQFGRVLIEAMASGVTVVGSSSGEIPNVIGDAGVVFPEGDVPALRRALESVVRDPQRRAALAVAGRARVLERYTQAQVAIRTCRAYREILGLTEPDGQSTER